jgi:hypothetical protein
MARKYTEYDERRRALRDSMWSDADDVVYNRRSESGFTTVPRTLPLVCTLLRVLGEKKNDPSRVYWELWCRQRDDGFVELLDPDELACCAGFYRGTTRRVRSLHEALEQLQELGFIRIRPKGPRKYGYVLVLHPHDVVQRLRAERHHLIPDWWWDLFTLRAREIKAKLNWKPVMPTSMELEGVELVSAEPGVVPSLFPLPHRTSRSR